MGHRNSASGEQAKEATVRTTRVRRKKSRSFESNPKLQVRLQCNAVFGPMIQVGQIRKIVSAAITTLTIEIKGEIQLEDLIL